jgi:hypothetical protein
MKCSRTNALKIVAHLSIKYLNKVHRVAGSIPALATIFNLPKEFTDLPVQKAKNWQK